MTRAFLLGAALLAAGCHPEVGPCDVGEARRVVYDGVGTPAFEGQALMIQSCGHGAFCHSSDIPIENRKGVPEGLEYDLRLASFAAAAEPEATERLRAMQQRAFAHRHVIWDQVARGGMPVRGAVGDEVLGAAPVYQRFDPGSGEGTPLPALDSEEGREVLRNWLACGLPVVERTEPIGDGQAVEAVGWVVPGIDVEPLAPNWPDIYARLVEPRCATGPCHGTQTAGGLDLRGESETLDRLVGGVAASAPCLGTGAPMIDTDNPDDSLFLQKMTGRDGSGAPVCGDLMPIGGARVDARSLNAIRDWIAAGAQP